MTQMEANFRAVVLNDSIMWGQGLFDCQKIHTLVANRLAEYGLVVQSNLQAHSGAIIGEPDVCIHQPPIDGEVPVSYPTIFEQLEAALDGKAHDESVNLVMISGGVNDVDITRILNPRIRNLEQLIEDAFYRKMKLLIERAYHSFPNAIIVITGYYKAFSEDSERSSFLNVLKGIGFALPLLPYSVGDLVMDMLGPRLTQALIERCNHFYNSSHECIREAIIDFVGMHPEARNQIYFADPNFKAEHAIGASEALLYGVNADYSPQDPPEIAERRAKACVLHRDRLDAVSYVSGPRASVGHPNPAGAQQYAHVILANIHYAMPTLFATEYAETVKTNDTF